MSLRFPSVAHRNHGLALLATEDAIVAARSPARLLITASNQQGVETVARRIHGDGPRARFPFLQTGAAELPVGPEALRSYCAGLLAAAAGGSVLVSAVEEMPGTVQEALIELLPGLESAGTPAAAVRLISGTTVSLLDRIAAGSFSAQLFYRLNVIHLMVGNNSPHLESQ